MQPLLITVRRPRCAACWLALGLVLLSAGATLGSEQSPTGELPTTSRRQPSIVLQATRQPPTPSELIPVAPTPLAPPRVGPGEAPATSGELRLRGVDQLTTDITPPTGELPYNHAAAAFRGEPTGINNPEGMRLGAPFYSTPRAAGFVHRPLYFEQRATERDGRSLGALQPAISGAAFFGTLPALPYHMAARPQPQRISTGDGVRPASDRLTLREQVRGAIGQAAATTGAVFIFP